MVPRSMRSTLPPPPWNDPKPDAETCLQHHANLLSTDAEAEAGGGASNCKRAELTAIVLVLYLEEPPSIHTIQLIGLT